MIDKAVPQGSNGHLDKAQVDWLRLMPDGWDSTSPEVATRYHELFGTPEKAARTLEGYCFNTPSCTECGIGCKRRSFENYDNVLEWLRGDAE